MKRIAESAGAWVRGLVWTAMVLGCAWASAQSYVVSPARYTMNPVGSGALAQGAEPEGGQNNNVKDDLFAGTEIFEKGATDVTEINMDPDSLNMVGGPDSHKAHRMVLNVVRTYEYDKPGMYNMADVDRFRNKLNTGDWRCSIHTRELKTGESTDVCMKRRTDGMREQAIISVSPRELTFIHQIIREGPGSSELGFFPMMPGMNPMTMMAMTDPDAFAEMQMGMHGMLMNLHPDVVVRLNDLKMRPFDEKEMKQLQDQFKSLDGQFKKLKPFDEQQTEQMNPTAPEAPDASAVPQAPEAPAAPQPK